MKTSQKIASAALILLGALFVIPKCLAAEELPFDPERICRLSVDDIPRSISIRQGADIWFGYDLERALAFKVWKAVKEQPGVILKGFTARSAGTVWFEEKTGDTWRIERDGETLPLKVRYLGCRQNNDNFELHWELSYVDGKIQVTERIPSESSKATRELRAESLERGTSLILPSAYGKAWLLTGPEGKPAKALTGSAWYQLSLRQK